VRGRGAVLPCARGISLPKPWLMFVGDLAWSRRVGRRSSYARRA
jgi:hypothetical protein